MRTLVPFLASVVLWALVSELNHAFAGFQIYLFIGGLIVTASALVLPLRPGLSASFLSGLLFDSTTPVPFGLHAVLFAATHVVVFHLRDRLPRDDTTGRVVIALLANLGLFLVFSFIEVTQSPLPAAAWPRLIADLVASQVFLTFTCPWFFALQHRALVLARVEPVRLL